MGFRDRLSKLNDLLFSPVSLDLKFRPSPPPNVTLKPDNADSGDVRTSGDVYDLIADGLRAGQPIRTDWTKDKAIKNGYNVNAWVYTCIGWYARSISQLSFEAREKETNNEWDKIDDNDCVSLLESPNPFETDYTFKERLVQHLLLCGNAIVLKNRTSPKAKPQELWIINPDKITPIPNEQDIIEYYVYKCGQVEQLIRVEDIIHFKLSDPSCWWWGCSPLKTLAMIIDTDNDAIQSWRWSMQNRYIKDGILQFKHELSGPQYQTVIQQLMLQAGPNNSRLPLVIGSDSSFTPTSMSPVDMDFMKGREMMKAEIAAAFGVPLILLGGEGAGGASYNNAQEVRKSFWEDHLVPFMRNIEATLTRSLMSDFADIRKIRIFADYSKVPAFKETLEAKLQQAFQYWQMGVPLNIINKLFDLGLPEITGGDFGYLPSTLLPLLGNPEAHKFYDDPGNSSQGSQGTSSQTGKKPNSGSSSGSGSSNSISPGIGGPKTETGNPTRAIAANPSKKSSEYWEQLLEFSSDNDISSRLETKNRQNLGKKIQEEFLNQERKQKIDHATQLVRDQFKREGKIALNEFKTKGIDGLLTGISYQENEWTKNLDYFWSGLYVDNSNVTKEHVKSILNTTANEIKQIYAAGKLTPELIPRIYDVYADRRANKIAEIEVLASLNTELDQKARRAKKQYKTWHTQEDDRVRHTHAEQDDVRLHIDDTFPNGCSYPSDPSAELSEIINCRCYLTYD